MHLSNRTEDLQRWYGLTPAYDYFQPGYSHPPYFSIRFLPWILRRSDWSEEWSRGRLWRLLSSADGRRLSVRMGVWHPLSIQSSYGETGGPQSGWVDAGMESPTRRETPSAPPRSRLTVRSVSWSAGCGTLYWSGCVRRRGKRNIDFRV